MLGRTLRFSSFKKSANVVLNPHVPSTEIEDWQRSITIRYSTAVVKYEICWIDTSTVKWKIDQQSVQSSITQNLTALSSRLERQLLQTHAKMPCNVIWHRRIMFKVIVKRKSVTHNALPSWMFQQSILGKFFRSTFSTRLSDFCFLRTVWSLNDFTTQFQCLWTQRIGPQYPLWKCTFHHFRQGKD